MSLSLPNAALANAHLIAAAPALLAALEGVIELANDPAGSTFKLREFLNEPEGKAAIAALALLKPPQ